MTAGTTLGRRAVLATVLAALATGTFGGPATLAHGPNPLLGTGTRWDKDQIVGYQWHAGGVPPAWAAAEIDAAAEDVAQSRGSRAATFQRVSKADSQIYYGLVVPCSSYGIACMNRTGVPDSFQGMWFRPHNWQFDWGALKWCQALASPVNGCYDVENVALDEFGHIELIGHHVNYDDESDYLDSIVQFAARSRAREGWNEHVFGRCDVARLQLEYGRIRTADPVSSCLRLTTTLGILAPTYASLDGFARVTGTLRIAVSSAAKELSGDALSARSIALQRRAIGSATWVTLGTLSPSTTAGSYGITATVTSPADYRLFYNSASTEGLLDATSAIVRISPAPTCTRGMLRGTTPHMIPPGC